MKKQWKYNLPGQKQFRKELRNGMTSAEIALWLRLKGRQLGGVKFRRQFGVGPFVLDFYAPALRLGIELDGRHHYTEEGMAYDRRRSDYLWREHGIRLLRFENRLVFESPELVLRKIGHFISEKQNGIEINIKHDDTEFD